MLSLIFSAIPVGSSLDSSPGMSQANPRGEGGVLRAAPPENLLLFCGLPSWGHQDPSQAVDREGYCPRDFDRDLVEGPRTLSPDGSANRFPLGSLSSSRWQRTPALQGRFSSEASWCPDALQPGNVEQRDFIRVSQRSLDRISDRARHGIKTEIDLQPKNRSLMLLRYCASLVTMWLPFGTWRSFLWTKPPEADQSKRYSDAGSIVVLASRHAPLQDSLRLGRSCNCHCHRMLELHGIVPWCLVQ